MSSTLHKKQSRSGSSHNNNNVNISNLRSEQIMVGPNIDRNNASSVPSQNTESLIDGSLLTAQKQEISNDEILSHILERNGAAGLSSQIMLGGASTGGNNNSKSKIYLHHQQQKNRLIPLQLESIMTKIQKFVDDVDNKIQNRVQLVKQVYLNEYKEQVLDMSQQLKHLRQLLDGEIMKQRANEKMFYLQEERDFFRSEVLKLNEEMSRINMENKGLKREIEIEKNQSENYKKIVYNLETKLIKMKAFNIKREKIMNAEMQKTSTNMAAMMGKSASGSGSGSGVDLKKTHKRESSLGAGVKTNYRYDQRENDEEVTDYQEQAKDSTVGGGQINRRLKVSHSVKSYNQNKFTTPQKDFMRTMATVNYPSNKKSTQKLSKIQGYSQLLQRQQIIEECLAQVKKQIYYRNLSQSDRSTNKIHFNEQSYVRFEQFTKTDKKDLVVRILSNDRLLNEFYEYLFGRGHELRNDRKDSLGSSSLVNSSRLMEDRLGKGILNGGSGGYQFKLTDARFNTKVIGDLKTEFNKKIFDIKHNR